MLFNKLFHTSCQSWLNFFRHSLLLAMAMLGAVLLKNGFIYDSTTTLLEAALLFGLFGGVCYRLILITEVRLFVERIGFFNIFLNAGILYLVTKILPTFHIEHFSTAFWAGLLISVFTWAINSVSIFAPVLIKKDTPSLKQARAKVIGTRNIQDRREKKS